MSMLWNTLAVAVGPLWLGALGTELLSVLSESAAGGKDANGEKLVRQSWANVLIGLSALAAPGLLYAHAYVRWLESSPATGAPLFGFLTSPASLAVLCVVVGGAILGLMLGLLAPSVRRTLHHAATPLSIAALALTIAAAWPSLPVLADALAARFGR